METEETKNAESDSSKYKALSIKERVKAADYAMEVSGAKPEDDDISGVIGEVYSG